MPNINTEKICAYIQEELNKYICERAELNRAKKALGEETERRKALLEEYKNKIAQCINEIDEKINALYDGLDEQTEKIDELIDKTDEKINELNDLLTEDLEDREDREEAADERIILELEKEIRRIDLEFA